VCENVVVEGETDLAIDGRRTTVMMRVRVVMLYLCARVVSCELRVCVCVCVSIWTEKEVGEVCVVVTTDK
jgi:hypothetical protein